MTRFRIAVVGGGINGAGAAWELARRDYDVVLFEKGLCGAQTSAASGKFIHGGLRYLEQFRLGLVRQSLHERAWLLRNVPELVKPIEMLLPVFEHSPRSRMRLRAGLKLYDLLSFPENIAGHRTLSAEELLWRVPLRPHGLLGGFSYWDGQVDDFALVRVVVAAAIRDGVVVREQTRVDAMRRRGRQWLITTDKGDETEFDLIVNAAGPWMNDLLRMNGIESRYRLSLVRGTHIVLTHHVSDCGMFLQSKSDRRFLFVTPWKGTTLVGATEVLQKHPPDGVHPTDEEIEYLVTHFNDGFREPIDRTHVASAYAGVRPLVGRGRNPSTIDRSFRVLRDGNLINVFGGKITTFMALARAVALRVDNYFGHTRTAKPPMFLFE